MGVISDAYATAAEEKAPQGRPQRIYAIRPFVCMQTYLPDKEDLHIGRKEDHKDEASDHNKTSLDGPPVAPAILAPGRDENATAC